MASAEEINALLQGDVPTLKSGGVAQVNPLAAITAGNQAAQAEFTTRDWQAKQAAGQAYQGAIDPKTGELDANKFRALLSQSGPAALQTGAALANIQNISSDDLNQQKLKLEQYNSSLGSLMAMGDNVTHADVVGKIQSLMAHKLMTLPEAQRIMSTIPEGQAGLAGWVKQHALTVADASTRFNQTLGTRGTVNNGPYQYNYTVPPPGQGTVETQNAPDPASTQKVFRPHDSKGQIPQNPDGSLARPPEGPITFEEVIEPTVNVPGVPRGSAPRLVPGTVPPPPGTLRQPSSGAPVMVPGQPPVINVPGQGNQPAVWDSVTNQWIVRSTTPPPMPPGARPDGSGRRQGSSLETGVRVASTDPSMAPQTGPPGAPSPMVAADVADIEAGMAQARGEPRPPGTQTAYDTRPPALASRPQGQADTLKANQEAYRAAQADIPNVMTRAQNTGKAYEALRLLKEMDSTTGVGATAINTVRSRLGTLGVLGADSMKVQQLQEEFGKYTEKLMLDAAGGGSTNLGKTMAEKSNPGSILSMGANFDVLRNDLGKVLQRAAAQMSHEDKTGGGFLAHDADIATKTDPRGFVWNAYDDTEKAKIVADAKRDGEEAVKRLKRAIGLSHELNLRIPGATTPPPPDKRSMFVPPGPAQNLLTMAG